MTTLQRPRVICHMTTSIDGRVIVDGWPDSIAEAVSREYENIHGRYDAQGWICGRITMEEFAGGTRSAQEIALEHTGAARADFIAPGKHDSYAFALDAAGKLAWQSADIRGDHVVAILCERVSDDYLSLLRNRGVSYVFAGAREIDLSLALKKIGECFGVKTLLLEGGGGINGSLLGAGLVDEVSLIVAPVTDGRVGTPALFDVGEHATPQRLQLKSVEPLADGLVWLRYEVATGSA
jgi:2,5-diamino-6-(ribosylamino)-4(3H)-pyrimidinone 5'-phosphate reductase